MFSERLYQLSILRESLTQLRARASQLERATAREKVAALGIEEKILSALGYVESLQEEYEDRS